MDALLLVVLIVVLVLIGIPIGFSLVGATLVMIVLDGGTSLLIVPLRLFNGTDSFAMVAVPLFIFAGSLMNRAGISARLIQLASSLIGFVRGGLAMTTTLTSMFFAEVSGSAVAGAAALGSVLVPAMKARGYPAGFAAAVLSSSSSIAIVMPPSIPMILYGSITGTSVIRLFLAGFLPGILIGLSIMVTSAVLARIHGFAEREPFQATRAIQSFGRALWALSLPLIILGGIFTGLFTATEAAAVAVVAAMLIGFVIYTEIGVGDLRPILREAGAQTGVVMMLVAGSAVLGWYLTNAQVPDRLLSLVTGYVTDRTATLLLLNAALLVTGMFLHSTAAIVVLVPIFMPLATELGLDPIHFGLIVTLNLAIGQQTPPVASVLITSCSLAQARVGDVMCFNVYFILAMLVVLLLVTFVPGIALWLPSTLLACSA